MRLDGLSRAAYNQPDKLDPHPNGLPLMRMFRVLLLLPLLLSVSACDSGEESPEIGGTYTTTFTEDGAIGTYRLVIPDTDSGRFTLGSASEISVRTGTTTLSIDVTGSGQYDYPNIQLTITTQFGDDDSDTVTLNGTVSASGDSFSLRDSEGTTATFTR